MKWVADFIRRLAPNDLTDAPLYAMATSEVGAELLPVDCSGVTGRFCDLAIQAKLEAAGEWQGRGYAFVVDNEVATSIGFDRGISADDAGLSIALHEFAHLLTKPPNLAAEPPRLEGECSVADIWAKAAAIPPEESLWLQMPHWYAHDARFIRALCHLLMRAAAAGESLSDEVAFCHESYQISPLSNYATTLLAELDDNSRSIAELLDTPPPPAFVALWRSDLEVWAAEHGADSPEYAAAWSMFGEPEALEGKFRFVAQHAMQFGEEITTDGTLILASLATSHSAKPSPFRSVVYSGGLFEGKAIIDVEGFRDPISARCQLLLDGRHVGHVTALRKADGRITVDGCIYAGKAQAEIVGSAVNGFPWQPKMRLSRSMRETIPGGKTVRVNGADVTGPITIFRSAELLAIELGGDSGETDFAILEETTNDDS